MARQCRTECLGVLVSSVLAWAPSPPPAVDQSTDAWDVSPILLEKLSTGHSVLPQIASLWACEGFRRRPCVVFLFLFCLSGKLLPSSKWRASLGCGYVKCQFRASSVVMLLSKPPSGVEFELSPPWSLPDVYSPCWFWAEALFAPVPQTAPCSTGRQSCRRMPGISRNLPWMLQQVLCWDPGRAASMLPYQMLLATWLLLQTPRDLAPLHDRPRYNTRRKNLIIFQFINSQKGTGPYFDLPASLGLFQFIEE